MKRHDYNGLPKRKGFHARGDATRRRSLAAKNRHCFRCGAPGASPHEIGDDHSNEFNLCPACASAIGARPPGSAKDAAARSIQPDEGTAWEPTPAAATTKGRLPARGEKPGPGHTIQYRGPKAITPGDRDP